MRRTAMTIVALTVLGVAGCAHQQTAAGPGGPAASQGGPPAAPHARPQAIEPVAGQATPAGTGSGAPAQVSVDSGGGALAQPVSDAVVRRELQASGLTANANQATLTPNGLAVAPIGAPPQVQAVIAAGNEIAHLPYRYGGGHGTYADTAYDCSGSISFAFEAAHLLSSSVVSGDLMNWGGAGPGRWITVFANAGHTFMYVAGLRFDTVALAETGSRWSNRAADEPDLKTFAVRHPPGL
jgi:hypothetical protein